MVERRDGDRPGRRLLDEHAEGREAQLGRLRPGTIPDDVKSDVDRERQQGHDHADTARPTRTGSRTTSSRRSRRCRWRGTSRRPARRPAARRAERRRSRQVTVTSEDDVEGHDRDAGLRGGEVVRGRLHVPLDGSRRRSSRATTTHDPLWQVVDGPWHADARSTRRATSTMVPNKTYSGPVKPKLDKFVELPFTVGRGRVQRARRRQGRRRLPARAGHHVDRDDERAVRLKPGANNPRLSGTTTSTRGTRGGSTTSPTTSTRPVTAARPGKIFKQLYFRQAFQTLVDQPLYIEKIYKGYGVPTYGPVPVLPDEHRSRPEFEAQQPVPVQPEQGDRAPHGARLEGEAERDVTTCADAAKCGVPAGTPLNFTLQYASGTPTEDQLMEARASRRGQQAGIKINLTTASFDTVIGNAVPCSGQVVHLGARELGRRLGLRAGLLPVRRGLSSRPAPARTAAATRTRRTDTLIKETTFGNCDLGAVRELRREAAAGRLAAEPRSRSTEINKNLAGRDCRRTRCSNINPENWYFTK